MLAARGGGGALPDRCASLVRGDCISVNIDCCGDVVGDTGFSELSGVRGMLATVKASGARGEPDSTVTSEPVRCFAK